VSDGRFGASTGAYVSDQPGLAALADRAGAEGRP
jgi:hypothetical protein